MNTKQILKYSPLALVLILEIATWFMGSRLMAYTVDHLIVFVLLYIGYFLIDVQSTNNELISKLNKTVSLLSKREFKSTSMLSLINYGYSSFDPKDFPKIWASLMWNSKIEFISSNHIHPRYLWNNQFADAALLIQKAKIANDNVSMSRLFVYEDDEELGLLNPAMEANHEAGLNVYYISKQRILDIPHLSGCIDKTSRDHIDTLAYNLIDGYALLLYDLDPKTRKIKTFRLAIDDQEYAKYKRFYLDVIKSANRFTGSLSANESV